MSDYKSVKDERVTSERERRECPNCGGDVIEPRSSDKWNCALCARQFDEDEL
jgi:ribosomal protein S27AE